jgi:exodeoxyribonuclease III
MQIVSYNVNGIRAALKKGLVDWLSKEPIDVLCLQETKATPNDIDVTLFENLGYHHNWFCAQKKGYSSVAIFSKEKPKQVIMGNGYSQSDAEGRVITAVFKNFTIVNAYFPSGTSGQERQDYKMVWLTEFKSYIKELQKTHKKVVVVGDYNIAHTEIDIHDPKGNKNSSGFLPDERAWLTNWFNDGMIDTLRHITQAPQLYSWWSQRFPSVRLQNKGWRIDYISVSKTLKAKIKDAGIWPNAKHSDHCPVWLTLDY